MIASSIDPLYLRPAPYWRSRFQPCGTGSSLRMGQDARWNLNGGRAQGVAQPQAASEACRQNIRRPVVDGTATLGPARGRKKAVVFPLRCCMLPRQIDQPLHRMYLQNIISARVLGVPQ